jgi:hypothetical protein
LRKLILHIGVHRTGTTAIQDTLGLNAGLLAQVGIAFPDLDKRILKDRLPPRAHHRIAANLQGLTEAESRLGHHFSPDDLQTFLATTNADYVILSAEDFSVPGLPRERLDAFVDSIKRHGFDVTAVVFVRPQPSLLNSDYVEHIKMLRRDVSFGDFLQQELGSTQFGVGKRLANWAENPKLNFVAVPYIPWTLGERIVETLLLAGGVDRDRIRQAGMEPALTSNENLGRIAIAAFRLIQRKYPALRGTGPWTRHLRNAQAELRRRNWLEPKFVGLTEAMATRIDDRYAAENEAFAQRVWGRSWKEVFAEEYAKRWESNEIDIEALHEADAKEFDEFADYMNAMVAAGPPPPPPRPKPAVGLAQRITQKLF